MYRDDPFRTRFGYSDYLQLPFVYRERTGKVLYIGLGGGSAPKAVVARLPGVRIDAVELIRRWWTSPTSTSSCRATRGCG